MFTEEPVMSLETKERYTGCDAPIVNSGVVHSNHSNVHQASSCRVAKDCPSLSDKLDPSEDRTRLHRHSLRTSLGGRVLRNRRYRPPFDDHRHTKRLFTPEIKKYLKDWLIRRREHPYPNREEKRILAVETGLTYIQICNWFANWRRKLKNAGSEDQRTWTHLITSYNTQAEGNVEQFSISSDDSIWERREYSTRDAADTMEDELPPSCYHTIDHSYSVLYETASADCASAADNVVAEEIVIADNQPQCFTISSTTTDHEEVPLVVAGGRSNKYKRHIMEKYMQDLRLDSASSEQPSHSQQHLHRKTSDTNGNSIVTSEWETRLKKKKKKKKKKRRCGGGGVKEMLCPAPKMLSKWLESAAKFQPTKSYVPWPVTKSAAAAWTKKASRRTTDNAALEANKAVPPAASTSSYWAAQGHQRAELDAAEALTCLSGLQ